MPPRNKTLRQKAALGLNKSRVKTRLQIRIKALKQATNARPSFERPAKESKGNEAAPIRLFGTCAKTSEPDALNLTAQQK